MIIKYQVLVIITQKGVLYIYNSSKDRWEHSSKSGYHFKRYTDETFLNCTTHKPSGGYDGDRVEDGIFSWEALTNLIGLLIKMLKIQRI